MKCPVCNNDFKNKIGCNIHLIKSKEADHIDFIKNQINIIIEYYSKNVPTTKMNKISVFKPATILKLLKNNFSGFKNQKYKICSIKNKKPKKRNLRIDENKKEEIKSFFTTNISLIDIGKRCGCDYKTVKRVFVFYFGAEATKNRGLEYRNGPRESRLEKNNQILYKRLIDSFNTDSSIKEICNLLSIDRSTLKKCWEKVFGVEKYEERKIKNIIKQKEKHFKVMKKVCFIGSKNEIYCYELLSKKYPLEIKHHDYSIVPRLEIDISIPNKKIAISWDGPGHRKPIYGEKSFIKMCNNDKIREKEIINKNWRYIIIEDNSKFNPNFVERKVEEIVELINKDFQGKVII